MAQFLPSPQQSAFFSYIETPNGGNAVVEAVAGAGKTTALVHGMERMTGEVFYGVYNTKMAKEAREKCSHLRHVWVKTFHAMGVNALRFNLERSLGHKLPDPDGKKVAKLVDAWIAEKGRAELTDIVGTVSKIVSMAKQRGIGIVFPDVDAQWMEMVEWFDLASDLPEAYEDRMDIVLKLSRLILKRSNAAARETGSHDFDDMIYLPLLWNYRFKKFDWVLVDEAQDTNPTRREMATRMMKPNARFIAVGDPHQAIYGFSGADNDALQQIKASFRAQTLPLTVTYRCPKFVVAVAQQFVSHIQAHESAPEGFYTEQPFEVLVGQLVPGDAVLCRYNKYLVNLCFKLIREGKPAKIEGRAIGAGLVALVSKWKVSKLDTLAERVVSWKQREMAKAMAKKNESKADQIDDRAETVLVLIERAAEQGIRTIPELKTMIASLFDDNVADKASMITLLSVHKSKGLEFPRVFILGLFELMGRECTQAWQTEQEINLQYVAVTRAQEFLCNVVGVKEEKKQHRYGEEG